MGKRKKKSKLATQLNQLSGISYVEYFCGPFTDRSDNPAPILFS